MRKPIGHGYLEPCSEIDPMRAFWEMYSLPPEMWPNLLDQLDSEQLENLADFASHIAEVSNCINLYLSSTVDALESHEYAMRVVGKGDDFYQQMVRNLD